LVFEVAPITEFAEVFGSGQGYNPGRVIDDVSVFGALNHRHELQNVAAHFQMSPGSVEKRYAVIITKQDCLKAGIEFSPSPGNTGCICVDNRHANLVGKLDNFVALVQHIVRRIWAGENRVHFYAAHALAGELGVFSCLQRGVTDGVITNCKASLDRSKDYHEFPAGGEVVNVVGSLEDKTVNQRFNVERVLVNKLRPPCWYHHAAATLARFLESE
jgi:hypothetical protein